VLWSKSNYEVTREELYDLRVEMTMVGGEIVNEAEDKT
jgi:hypothetical protein